MLVTRECAVRLPSGAECRVRPGRTADAPEATRLIHEAFSIWKEQGLKLSPMFQTEADTERHLVGKGFVATDAKGALVGTFSLDDGSIRKIEKANLRFIEGNDDVEYSRSDFCAKPIEGRWLVFKKAAVKRDAAHSGLGSRLYGLAETLGRENGYHGMALETVAEAVWLYDWYVRLGFVAVGRRRYSGAQLDTILMIKPFAR